MFAVKTLLSPCLRRINRSAISTPISSRNLYTLKSEDDEPLFPETTVPQTGFELVLERTSNVIKGIAEKNLSRVLHINCGGNLVKHFGNTSVIDLAGVTDDPVAGNAAKLVLRIILTCNV